MICTCKFLLLTIKFILNGTPSIYFTGPVRVHLPGICHSWLLEKRKNPQPVHMPPLGELATHISVHAANAIWAVEDGSRQSKTFRKTHTFRIASIHPSIYWYINIRTNQPPYKYKAICLFLQLSSVVQWLVSNVGLWQQTQFTDTFGDLSLCQAFFNALFHLESLVPEAVSQQLRTTVLPFHCLSPK
jgi:hypothetical protein